MKHRKILSWAVLTGLAVSLFTGMIPAAAEMTPEEKAEYYSYTMGNFESGYEGYAYKKEADFASLEELQSFPPIASGSGNKWDGISVVDGKPVMSQENDVIDFLFPDYDNKELAKPTKQKSYALLRYSLSSKDTNFQSSPGQTTRHQNGKMEINQKGPSGVLWTAVTEDIANFDANDILTIKTFQDATRQNDAKLLEYTSWINNETKNTGFVQQLENVNPQSSASNQNIKNYNAKVLAGNKGSVTIYEWACYDQYEYLLREIIRNVESQLLGKNMSLHSVTQDLVLPQDLALELDKGHTGSVTWSSTDAAVVDPATGTVTRSETEDKQVTLTAVYKVTGEEGEQTKTITYAITVPTSGEMTPEEAFYNRYTIGQFVSGYEGYAYENDLNFASLEELQNAENINVENNNNITIEGGKPSFNKGSLGKIVFLYPDKDIMGHEKPTAQKMYSVTEFERSTSDTYINISSGTGIKSRTSEGTVISYRKDNGDEGNQRVTSEFEDVVNEIVGLKLYQDATRKEDPNGLLRFTSWLQNVTDGTEWILQKEDYNPRWGSTNTTLTSVAFQSANYSGGSTTAHSVAAYERFEYLLRELVGSAEKELLQENASLDRVETDLRLLSGTFELDKGCKGSVTWESSDEAAINPSTGKVDRSTTEDKTVTLTATYRVTDEAGETKEKTIAYELFIPMNAPLRKLVDLFTWDKISNTQSADNVRVDLNLVDSFSDPSVPDCTADITWEVLEGAEAVTPEGVVTRLPEGDTAVTLKAAFSADGLTVEKEFDFVVPRYISPQEETDTVAEQLTWEVISTEADTAVTKNLTLPTESPTVDGNTASITWTVLAGGNAVSADGTVTQQGVDTFVSLEAVIVCNGAETRKQFDFVVLSPNTELTLFDADFTVEGDSAIENSSYAQAMTVETVGTVPEGYSAQFLDGKGLQLQSAGENADTDILRVNWDMRPSAADPDMLEELKTITTYEITAYVVGSGQANARFTLVDQNGRNAVLFTPRNDFVGIQAGNKWNPQGRAPWAEAEVYPTLFDGETGPRITFRADYNNVTGEIDAYAKLPDYTGPENYGEWYPLAMNVAPNNASVQGSLTGLQIESLGKNTVIIESVRCYTTAHALKSVTADIVEALDYMNGQETDFVTGNLEFPQAVDQYGASLSWKTEPTGYFDGKGNLISRPDAYETVPVAITPVITFDNAAWASAAPAFPPQTVTIVGVNEDNIALYKKVSISGAQAAEGSSADYITDGSLERGFVSAGAEQRFDVVLDVDDAQWNKVRITEGEPYNVASYEISVSEDRRNWETVHSGAALQNQEVALDTDTGYQYLRLSITGKTVADAAVHLMELEVFFEPSDAYRAEEDFKQVSVPAGLVSQNFTLPAKGTVYGSEFTWTSSRSDLAAIAAEPSGDTYLVTVTQPQRNTPVTLTLTAGGMTKTYQITVQGTSYGTGGTGGTGGSGGGGGNRVSGGNASTLPYIPTQANNGDEQQPQQYFPDVSGWAEEYINILYEKQIVSGDQQGNFNPDATVTRGEFVKMLTLTLGIMPDAAADIPFTDVPAGHWARPYIAAAYRLGIVSGISDTKFGLDQPVTRQDLAVMCDRALEKTGRFLQASEETMVFTDVDAIADYAYRSVENMQRYGIIDGMPDGGFHPEEFATRAESAKILCGLLLD